MATIDLQLAKNAVERRYGAAAASEWERVRNHFLLGEGFALMVLVVPDRDGGEICRTELEAFFSEQHKGLVRIEPDSPDELQLLASRLFELRTDSQTGAVWISAVVPQSAPNFETWAGAWRYALAGLNQHRNPLRRQFKFPVIFVLAPPLLPLFRDNAPDLWSVRTLVAHIEPSLLPQDLAQETATRETPARESLLGREPVSLLRSSTHRKELEHARELESGGETLFARGDFHAAESRFRDAANLREQFTTHWLGLVVLDQGRAEDAEDLLHQALALEEQGGATAVARAAVLRALARALSAQGRKQESQAALARAALLEEWAADSFDSHPSLWRRVISVVRRLFRSVHSALR